MKIPVQLETPLPDSTTTVQDSLKIGVVILNWNKPIDTLHCLEAISTSTYNKFEIIIVDNGSNDDSLRILHQAYPNLVILESNKNLGYTGGNNLGIRHLLKKDIDYLLILNDDTVIDADTIGELAYAASLNPDVGFYGPKIFTLEQPEVLLSAGGILDKNYQPSHRGIGERDTGQYDQSVEVDFLFGCALLVKRQVIEAIGFLDDDYFAYHEEIDWCFRGKRAGFQIQLVPKAKAWHPDTRQRDDTSVFVTYYITRNSLLFIKKNHLGSTIILKMLFNYLRRWLSWRIRPKWRQKSMQRIALRQALFDFALHRYGKWEPRKELS